ncbi:MAG: polysaccharide deacetylase [Firmicutes bacterium]|nr:polysaccharide deacetylase [Bacillota bacterium]
MIFFLKKQPMKNKSNKKIIYLTFDDGPSKNTSKILDILLKYDIKATFFVCGNTTSYGEKIYTRLINEGHKIGNHTFTHNYNYLYSNEENFYKDIKKLENLLLEKIKYKPDIIRFPGGSNTTIVNDKFFMERLTTKMLLEGYQYFDWNIDSLDANKITQEKNIIVNTVLKNVKYKNKSIILFHDSTVKTTTVEALEIIIYKLKKMGYIFEVLSKNSYYVHFT